MKTNKQHQHILYLTQLAVLIAIMLVLELTGIGMIKVGALEMTILQVPVIVGAIVMGPAAGGLLGLAFGLISFWECFGRSPFGATLLGINPYLTFLVCVPTRTLMGWLCGLIFRALGGKTAKLPAYMVSSLSGAFLNTVLFMAALLLCFGNSDYILEMRGSANILAFVASLVGLQGLVEAILCTLLGTAIGKGVCHALKSAS